MDIDARSIGAIEALNTANRKVSVVGINDTKEAVDAVKAGKLLASGQADPFMPGCLGTIIAIRSLRTGVDDAGGQASPTPAVVRASSRPSSAQSSMAANIMLELRHGRGSRQYPLG